MARSARSRPLRPMVVLAGLIAALFALVGVGAVTDDAQWSPKLALDLEGGTQIILTPVVVAGQGELDPRQIDEAVRIIQRRVNGSGVSEAEVTRQGSNNIVVSLPGERNAETEALVTRAAQLQFRAVLVAQPTAPEVTPTPTGSPSGTASPSPTGSARTTPTAGSRATPSAGTASPSAVATPSASRTDNGMAVPKALLAQPRVAATTTPTAGATGSPSTAAAPSPTGSAASPGASASASPSASPGASPRPSATDPSDLNQIDEAIGRQFEALDCTDAEARQKLRGTVGDPAKPLVTCAEDGQEKYILGPAEVLGTDVSGAEAEIERNSQGFAGTAWQVTLSFTGDGGAKFGKVTTRLVGLQGNQNRFGIVLDNLVISAPTTNDPILNGQAQITGGFTQDSAQELAQQLKYGALPVSFEPQTIDQISATLGSEQLLGGLLAGLVGMLLVVGYSLLQYRALGLVTVASLLVVALITYGLVLLLGWRQGFRLSLPGVVGLVVSIGITADSFIVYFERIRDEVRDGRSLQAAVEVAWVRARRTILASDAVNFLAAAVLFILAVGGVKGFAFTLGLTTLVDVLVVFLFTKPMVTLLARTPYFADGHRLSGFDAKHLGRTVAYAGRGRIRSSRPAKNPAPAAAGTLSAPARDAAVTTTGGGLSSRPTGAARPARGSGMTIAERRAAQERAARGEPSEPTDDGGAEDGTSREQERSGATGRDA